MLIFVYSKLNSLCLVVLLEKVGILKDKNTSFKTFRRNEQEMGVSPAPCMIDLCISDTMNEGHIKGG